MNRDVLPDRLRPVGKSEKRDGSPPALVRTPAVKAFPRPLESFSSLQGAELNPSIHRPSSFLVEQAMWTNPGMEITLLFALRAKAGCAGDGTVVAVPAVITAAWP